MPTEPKPFPEEYLYSLSRPSAPPPKKRRWWIAVSAAALLLLLFLGALALSRLEKEPTLHTDPPPDNIPSPDATDGLTETAAGLLDSEIVTEPETEDGLGFYEGTEVYVYQLPYDREYFTDHPVFTDGDLRLVLGNDYSTEPKTHTFTLSKDALTDGTVPAVRYHGDYGFSDQTSFFYRNTTAEAATDEVLYHTYTNVNGRMEFDYSPDGKLMEFRYAERSAGSVSKEDAMAASEQFLRAAGIDLTVGYKAYAAEGCHCIYGGEGVSSSQLTRVTWIREIGSTFAEGYTVFCMSTEDGVAVKLCKSLNLGLCEAYGSITGEQVHHTRARLWEAISAMRHYEGDAYKPKDSCKWGSLIMGEDGNLYLRIHFQGQSLGHSREGYAYMRVNP